MTTPLLSFANTPVSVFAGIRNTAERAAKRLTNMFSGDPDELSITVLKVLAVAAPAFFFWALESVRQSLFGAKYDSVQVNFAIAAVVTMAAYVFSRVVFGEIDRIQKQVVRRNEELTVVNTVASAVNQSLSLNVVLQKALDKVLQATGADAAEIFLLDPKTGELVPTAGAGEGLSALNGTRFKIGEGPVGMAALSAEPVIVDDVSDNPFFPPENKPADTRFLACLPLESSDTVVGVFVIATHRRNRLGSDDIRLLVNTGTHIAVAIQNAQLHEMVKAAAAIEERERIAREMHDGVAQVLSYLNVKTQAVKSFLDSGQIEATRAQLQEMEDTCQEAYSDVKESILGLRLATANTALGPALKEFISHFRLTADLEVTLEMDEEHPPVLSTAHEVQVIRIVQEGLTNVRKHAEARHARVRLATKGNLLEVTITDDGKGFDNKHLPKGEWPQFGLRMMQERAECINGTLDVTSAPGQGTKVELKVPITGGHGHESSPR